MVGKYQLEFNEKQFGAGISTADATNDGGIAPSSKGTNLTISPGNVYATAAETIVATVPSAAIIASCEDNNAVPQSRVFLDTAGNFYGLTGGVLTKIATGGQTYVSGAADLVAFNTDTSTFKGTFYATRDSDITKLTWNHSTAALDETWWSVTKSKGSLGNTIANHPLLVYNLKLWVADISTGTKSGTLNSIDSTESISTGVLTFNPNEFIYALGIDPGTGLMMISTSQSANGSDATNQKYWIYLYDGFSGVTTRKIAVDDLVTAFYNVGGRVYVGMGTTLGMWNGNGVTFLRNLDHVSFSSAQLPTKHKFSNYKSTVLVSDGQYVLAYGPIKQKSDPVFYYPYIGASTTLLSCMTHVGSGVLANAYVTGGVQVLALTDLTSTAAGTSTVALQTTYFPRPVFIRRLRLFTTGLSSTGGSIEIVDEASVVHQPTVFSMIPSGTQYVFDFDFTSLKLQTLQPIVIQTSHWGLTRAVVFYDIAE